MESPKKSLEEQLREAAYTVVGIGTVAYKASEPYRRKAEQNLEQFTKKTEETIQELARKGRTTAEQWRQTKAAPETKAAPASNEEHRPESDQG